MVVLVVHNNFQMVALFSAPSSLPSVIWMHLVMIRSRFKIQVGLLTVLATQIQSTSTKVILSPLPHSVPWLHSISSIIVSSALLRVQCSHYGLHEQQEEADLQMSHSQNESFGHESSNQLPMTPTSMYQPKNLLLVFVEHHSMYHERSQVPSTKQKLLLWILASQVQLGRSHNSHSHDQRDHSLVSNLHKQ